jgi:hypothetical protein
MDTLTKVENRENRLDASVSLSASSPPENKWD